MIRIEIDTATKNNPDDLRAVAAMLLGMAQGGTVSRAIAEHTHTGPADGRPTAVHSTIHPDDSPAAGTPSAASVFGKGPVEGIAALPVKSDLPDPASVFGGNAGGALSSAGAEASLTAPVVPAVTSTSPIVPPPPVQVPVPPVAGAVPPPPNHAAGAGLDLDTDGLPWDARIHASTKTKIKSGQWKAKKGVDDGVVAAVEAQLRAVVGGEAANPLAQFKTAAELGLVPPPPPVPVVAVTPPAVQAPSITFPLLCGKITAAINSGQLTHAQLGAALNASNLENLPTLVSFPHLVPVVAAALGFA